MKPGSVWRSLLYVPVNVEKYVDKATRAARTASSSTWRTVVPAHEKDNAHKLVAQAAKRVRAGERTVAVRITGPTPWRRRDLEAAIGPSERNRGHQGGCAATCAGWMISSPSSEASAGLAPGHTRFIAMVETPAAFFKNAEIALAVERTAAMDIGGARTSR